MLSFSKIGAIGRTYRHLIRYRRIVRVLFKYGFGDLVDHLGLDFIETSLQMISRRPKEQIDRLTSPERLRLALEDLGPTFIKLGQILSTRPDLIGPSFLKELSRLQDNVPPFSWSAAREIILAETGQHPEELFQEIYPTPIAAASIGQVYLAVLADGTRVAVKVQRPGIDKIIEVDLEILDYLSRLMEEHLEEAVYYQPTRIVAEFARSLSLEIDYHVEAANTRRFTQMFEADPAVLAPRVFPKLSAGRIITMEYVDGIKASRVDLLRQRGHDLRKIAARGARMIMEQVFVHGFFHADPHPGNIFILPGDRICLLDFGMVGRLSTRDRGDFTDLIVNVLAGKEKQATNSLIRLTTQQGEIDREALSSDLADLLDRYIHLSLKEINAGRLLEELLDLVARHRLSFKPNLFLMLKALSTVEGVGLALDPDFELLEHARPFMRKVIALRYRPRRLAEALTATGGEYLDLVRDLPEELRVILGQLRDGRLKIEFVHVGLDPLRSSLDQVSNRIAFAIVLAALVIGSSLIVLSGIPPHWNGIPLIGLLGFLIAGVMGFWLLLSIIRHGRM